MAREVFIALFKDLAAAEQARRDLERAGIPATEIDLRSPDLTGFDSSDMAPDGGGLWAELLVHEPRYRQHLEDSDGTLLAVRADGADYDRIASLLLRHDLMLRQIMPDKTSESPRIRRYRIAGEDAVPLYDERIKLNART